MTMRLVVILRMPCNLCNIFEGWDFACHLEICRPATSWNVFEAALQRKRMRELWYKVCPMRRVLLCQTSNRRTIRRHLKSTMLDLNKVPATSIRYGAVLSVKNAHCLSCYENAFRRNTWGAILSCFKPQMLFLHTCARTRGVRYPGH